MNKGAQCPLIILGIWVITRAKLREGDGQYQWQC